MRLAKVRPQELERAVGLYLLAEDWTSFSHCGLNDADAQVGLTAPNSTWRFLVEDSEDKTVVVGLVGFEKINPMDKVAEPFIALYPNAQSKGKGLKAMELLFELGTKQIGLRRIQTIVLPDAPSQPFLEKLGFTCEGILKKLRFKDGEYIDGLLYAWVDKEK